MILLELATTIYAANLYPFAGENDAVFCALCSDTRAGVRWTAISSVKRVAILYTCISPEGSEVRESSVEISGIEFLLDLSTNVLCTCMKLCKELLSQVCPCTIIVASFQGHRPAFRHRVQNSRFCSHVGEPGNEATTIAERDVV